MFDRYAKQWDSDDRIKRARLIADEILENIDFSDEMNALEFGCGTGLISFFLNERLEKVTMVDPSEGMLDILKDKIDTKKVENMEAVLGDINTILDRREKFDIIYTSMVLHHIKNVEEVISGFYKLLNEDGIICIVDIDAESGAFHGSESDFDGHNGFDQDIMNRMLMDEGFSEVSSHTFYRGVKENGDKKVNYSLFISLGRK